MKRQSFILLCIVANAAIILLHIYNYSQIIEQQYKKQRLLKAKEELMQKKSFCIKQLYTLKNPSVIKQYASQELHMQKISLNQIRAVSDHDEK
jgi:hypothetical protein